MVVTRGVRGWFASRGIRFKVYLAVVAIAVCALSAGALSVRRLAAVGADFDDFSNHNVARLDAISSVRGAQARINDSVVTLVLPASDQQGRTTATQAVNDAESTMEKALAAYRDNAFDSRRRARIEGLMADWAKFANGLHVHMLGDQPRTGVELPPDVSALGTLVDRMNAVIVELAGIERAESRSVAAEERAQYRTTVATTVVLLLVGLLIGLATAELVVRSIVRSVNSVSQAVRAMAEGNLTRHVEVRGDDELGRMAADVNLATASVRQAVGALADGARALTDHSVRLSSVSDEITASAREASDRAGRVAAAADQVSRNVRTVSDSSQEMSGAIGEIARSASDGAKVASRAVEVAETTNVTITKLGDSSAKIGAVVKVINSIAEQTNLLALNATIEAARAGDAGKGFAVVAGEVKDLAQETARATEDITRRVAAIQTDTTSAVAAIGEIGEIITQINAYQLAIASAVDEQTATTDEMYRNVAAAASGSADIAHNIADTARAAERTATVVDDSHRAAGELANLADDLRQRVSAFHY